jgi:hypothetical protein
VHSFYGSCWPLRSRQNIDGRRCGVVGKIDRYRACERKPKRAEGTGSRLRARGNIESINAGVIQIGFTPPGSRVSFWITKSGDYIGNKTPTPLYHAIYGNWWN